MAPNHDNSGTGQQQTPLSPGTSGTPLVPMGDNSESQSIVASARSSAGGFEMGGDRAIANPPNWNSQQSQELYNGAVTDNDPGTAEATGQQWTKHGTELKQASDHLYNAISELGNAWVGHGAAGAQGALVSIANSGQQASDAAHTMADRLGKQASAAAEVKKMPAPRDFDPKQAMAAALAGGPAAMAADQKVQADAANDVKAQQVAFFNAYTQSMSEVDGSTPSFGPDSLGMKPTASHFNGNSFNSLNGGSHSGNIAGGPGVGTPAFGGPVGVGAGGHASALGTGGPHVTGDSGTYGASGAAPAALPAAGSGAGAGAVSGAAAITPSAPAGGGGAGGVGSALGLGAVSGGLGFAGAKLGQGTRSGSRNNEESTSAAAEHQNGQSAASAVPQQGGVVPAGGTIGGQTAAPGMGGSMGGMGGGMGGGQGQEDEEHTHASFLIEPDPDDAFGANEATPPPVIGAWSDEDDD